jgi:hypothetical protein
MTAPIAVSPCRSGFGPQLALSYDSGAGAEDLVPVLDGEGKIVELRFLTDMSAIFQQYVGDS